MEYAKDKGNSKRNASKLEKDKGHKGGPVYSNTVLSVVHMYINICTQHLTFKPSCEYTPP